MKLFENEKIVIPMVLGFVAAHCVSIPILYVYNMLEVINYITILFLTAFGVLSDQTIYIIMCVLRLKKNPTMKPKDLLPYSLKRTFFVSFVCMTIITLVMVCLKVNYV